FHLGELARAQNALDRARQHYLTALSLAGGPPPLRQRITELVNGMPPAGAAEEPRRQAAPAAAADRRERREVPHRKPSGEGPAVELLRLLVRALPCGVTAPEIGVREIPERPRRRVPAGQHR